MKTSTLFSLLASLALSSPWSLVAAQESAADAMIANAAAGEFQKRFFKNQLADGGLFPSTHRFNRPIGS